MSQPYAVTQPDRAVIDTMPGVLVLEFGVDWCGHCRAAAPLIAAALAEHPGLQHIKVEDGSGRKLGRSFRVKLWPTLILLEHGAELARLVRPVDTAEVLQALAIAVRP